MKIPEYLAQRQQLTRWVRVDGRDRNIIDLVTHCRQDLEAIGFEEEGLVQVLRAALGLVDTKELDPTALRVAANPFYCIAAGRLLRESHARSESEIIETVLGLDPEDAALGETIWRHAHTPSAPEYNFLVGRAV